MIRRPAGGGIGGAGERCYGYPNEIGQYLAAEIVKLGPFDLLCDSNPATSIIRG